MKQKNQKKTVITKKIEYDEDLYYYEDEHKKTNNSKKVRGKTILKNRHVERMKEVKGNMEQKKIIIKTTIKSQRKKFKESIQKSSNILYKKKIEL